MKNLIQIAISLVIILSLSSSLLAGPTTSRYFFIQAKVSKRSLSNGNSMNVGKPIIQKAGPKDSKRWRFIPAGRGYYYILSKKSGLYLQVSKASKSARAIVIQNSINESNAQKWKLESAGKGYYFIQSKYTYWPAMHVSESETPMSKKLAREIVIGHTKYGARRAERIASSE